MAGLIEFEIFFDYTCPFVYRSSLLLASVAAARPANVRWRYFSLTQVNSTEPGWTVWDAPAGEGVRGRLAFKAAEAARRQDRFDVYHVALLNARHHDRLDIDDPAIVQRVAAETSLDLERFRRDLDDPAIIQALARDHKEAVAGHGVFGTPTFVFPMAHQRTYGWRSRRAVPKRCMCTTACWRWLPTSRGSSRSSGPTGRRPISFAALYQAE